MTDAFLDEARAAYVRVNAGTLAWMLERPRLHGVFLDTKQNAITLRDYDAGDSWRGPDVTCGWIQGRGLEALVTHARFFEREDAALAARLDAAAQPLFGALANSWVRDGHAYFAYDRNLRPIYPGPNGDPLPQRPPGDLYTYSDIFVLKGLIAASARFEPTSLPNHVRALSELVRAVEERRFVMDERQALVPEAVSRQRDEYGPRMILLGAAALLCDLGFDDTFGRRFVDHVLSHHRAGGPLPAGTLCDWPGGDHFNPGHAIEFAGFALELLPTDADARLIRSLQEVLHAAFTLGFDPPGIRLHVSLSGTAEPSPYRPWWSLPETVRAAALAYERTRNPKSLAVWQTAHEAFFAHYWRGAPPIAYQTLTDAGPVDYVPATPDLDPGYHTGLSFLGAIHAIDRMQKRPDAHTAKAASAD